MERGSLRPVPFRPAGPIDPAEAVRHVGAWLPELDDPAGRALALVEIAGRSRDDVAAELSLDGEALADALYRARKALRRSMFPLSATGWCERAERLLSDRLDGVLETPGPARLEAHLRHCGRCVEHDRRLAQARDTLVREYAEAHAPPAPEPEPEPQPPAELRVVVHETPAEPEPPPPPPPPPAPGPLEPAADTTTRVGLLSALMQGSRIWSALYLVAVLLAVASVVLTVLAATGAVERIF